MSATRPEDSPVRIAFLGCGAIAGAHARELAKIPGARVVAYWNRTHERAEKMLREFGGEYAAKDFQRIADDPSIDAVYVNTMHNDRLRLVEALSMAGKPIFSEKPLAHDAPSLRALHALVRRHRARFWSGVKIRFHTLMEQARAFLPAPEVLTAHVLDETWPEGHLNDPAICGGNVLAQGVYATESVRVLAGAMPVAVTALLRSARHPQGAPDTLCAAFEFANGAIASVAIADAGVGPGAISKFLVTASAGNRSLALSDRYQRLDLSDGNAKKIESLNQPEDGFCRQSEAFLAAVRGRGPWTMTFLEGAIPSIMALRAVDAARSGRREQIDCAAFLDADA
jgi:predicted dehydrogenase